MNIKIICEGRLKEKYLRDMCDEYTKRLGAFCKCEIVQLNPVSLPDNPGEKQIADALNKEGSEILSKITPRQTVIALCIEGKMLSSEELAKKMSDFGLSGSPDIAFVIGSSCGLSEEVKKRANLRLSMSPMTFPHQLARVMLLEQIYRSFMITSGGKYHK